MYYCRPGTSALPGLLRPISLCAGRCPASGAAPFDRAWEERDDIQAEGCAPSLGGVMWPYVARQVQGWTKLRDLP